MPIRPRRHPPAPQPGPVGQLGRLSETVVAFAGGGRASIETVVAFAGEKWAFLVQFSGAEVMPVSAIPYWGRAVVLVVSTAPRYRASRAKKFALHAYIGPNLAISGVLGEFFRGRAAGGAVLGEYFRANRYCAGLGCSAVHFRLAAVGLVVSRIVV